VTAIREVISLLLLLALVVLLGRLVLDWVQVFARDWRPRGAVLVVAEGVYTVTDPPIKAIRRVIPPLRVGGMSIDLAFMVLLIAIYILRAIV
jgi:YggT family protein